MTDAVSRPRIALVGNPNTGKTTLFNMLTGLNQRTGNFPGCTVEKKTGICTLAAGEVEIMDLPGTYSLAALSPDEMVVSETLLNLFDDQAPIDAVLVVVNAACLHRNLYLVHQLSALGMPTMLALNMSDQAIARGIHVDSAALQEALGFPVVATNATSGEGLAELKQALAGDLSRTTPEKTPSLFPEIEEVAARLCRELTLPQQKRRALQHLVFRALIDEESVAGQRLNAHIGADFAPKLQTAREELERRFGRMIDHETRLRYDWVSKVINETVRTDSVTALGFSERADRLITHPVLGIVILLALLAFIFQSIYTWSGPLMDLTESTISLVGNLVGDLLAEGMLRSLVVDGIIGGAGGVLVFLPQIIMLFLFIAILEDCGYMARAAFLLDRLFKGFGLSGKSLIPMLSSFACAVPGLMATRGIEDRRDRFTTILVAPFMSCSARLPVYVIMIAAFIPDRNVLGPFGLQGLTLLLMYLVGVLAAVPTAWLLKRTLLKGVSPPFLMELPSYKRPSPRTVGLRVFQAGREFILRAGTTIMAVSIVVWALAYFPRSEATATEFAAKQAQLKQTMSLRKQEIPDPQGNPLAAQAIKDLEAEWREASAALERDENGTYLRNSALGRMGRWVAPVVAPLGWDWRIGMATLASFPAREIIIATLGVIFNLGDELDETSPELRETLRSATNEHGAPLFNVPVALSIMVFFALCAQCAATLAVIKKETGSWRYPIFSFSYMTLFAYLAAFTVYQTTHWLGW